MSKLLRRLNYWLHRRKIEEELAEEIELHRALKQEEFEKSGLRPEEATFASRRSLGNALLAREDSRGVWIPRWFDELSQDIGYGLRQLRRNPGFTLVAVLTLAIGIGVNSAVFTIVNSILLEALPYKDPSRLVLIFEKLPNAPVKFGVSPTDYNFVHESARSYSGMAAYRTVSYELSGVAQPERLTGARIAPELFSVVGVAPVIGRSLTADDDQQQSRVAVLSHGLWSRAFGRDQAILGRSILLDGQPYTVVGVMPQSFEFPPRGLELNGEPAQVFVPMSFTPFERQAWGMMYNDTIVARLKPDVSLDQARAEMASLMKPLQDHYPAPIASFVSGFSLPMSPFNEEVVGRSRRLLLVLTGAVAMVLLISCADVANLILTRSGSRQREIAIRSSLGAGPRRIIRQLVTEALTLALAGGSLGLLLAYFSMQALLSVAGKTLPRAESITIDYHAVVFTAVIALLTPLVFALLPALRTAFASDAETLKHNAHNATPAPARSRLMGAFIVAQVALALVLSVGAGLLVRSFLRLVNTDPGFRPEQVVHLTTTLPGGRYATPPQVRLFYERAVEAAKRIPGVLVAAAGNDLPLAAKERRAFTAEGNIRDIPEESRLIAPHWTSPDYFQALGIPLKRGRLFSDGDTQKSQPVAIINEVVASMLWPESDPIGGRVKWGIAASQSPWMTIIGVVGDVKHGTLDAPAMAQIYVPLSQQALGSELFRTVNLVVRSDRDANSVISDLRTSIQQLDPELPVTAASLNDVIGESLKPQRFSTSIVMIFAVIALGLAAVGIYGVLANAVSQETHEIGVRIALGATSGDVIWMVLRRTLIMMAIGVGIGIAGARALTQVMSGLLYEIRPTDATAFIGAALVLACLAIGASLVPAWRATRVDPLIALKDT